jgi:hypothetical protein
MVDDDGRASEIQDTLDTTDQLHNDMARLKRLHILTPEEHDSSQRRIDDIVETLEEKLPGD